MQRSTCVSRFFPLCRNLLLEPSRPRENLRFVPLITIAACRFASLGPCSGGPKVQRNRSSRSLAKLPLSTFLKRTEDTKKILQLFDTIEAWDERQTPLELFRLGVPFHCYTVSEVILRCSHPDIALEFFYWLKRRDDFESDSYVYNALIYLLGKDHRLKEMVAIASLAIKEGKASVVNFTTLISAFRSVKDLCGALRTWHYMRKLGFQPSAATCTVMIDLFCSLQMYYEAGACYSQMLKARIRPSIRTCSILIHHLVEADKLDAAADIFNNLLKVKLRPNRVTYACIMMGHAKAGDMETVLKLVKEFKEYGHSPLGLGESFTLVLHNLVDEGRLQDAEEVMKAGWPNASYEEIREKVVEFQKESRHRADMPREVVGFAVDEDKEEEEEADEEGYECGSHTSSNDAMSTLNVVALVKCLALWSPRTGAALEKANIEWNCHLVAEVLQRLRKAESGWNFYCWVATRPGYCHDRYTSGMMIRLLLRSGQFSRVKQILLQVQQNDINLTLRTYASILKQCGLWKNADFAIEVFERLKASGLTPDEMCYKYFVHSLYKCQQHWRVASVCLEMQESGFSMDEAMYSFLITGFVRAGNFSKARQLNKDMHDAGFKPSLPMLNALIQAFYERGRLDKAETVFKYMRQRRMTLTSQTCKQMAEILFQLGQDQKATKLRAEMKALVPESKKARQARQSWFLRFHSIFVESFKDDAEVQSRMEVG